MGGDTVEYGNLQVVVVTSAGAFEAQVPCCLVVNWHEILPYRKMCCVPWGGRFC